MTSLVGALTARCSFMPDETIAIEEELHPTRVERTTLVPDYDVEGFARTASGAPEAFEECERLTLDIPEESLSALVYASLFPPCG